MGKKRQRKIERAIIRAIKKPKKIIKLSKPKYILSALIILLTLFLIIINSFYYKNCATEECFNTYLKKCSKVKFIGGERMFFEYKIQSIKNENCIVNVKLLQGDLNNQDSLELEKKQMKCEILLGLIIVPEAELDNCHGELKEGLQNLIITKLHKYIVQNLGEINVDLYGLG